jgi:sphingomyelin phosphodiesterase
MDISSRTAGLFCLTIFGLCQWPSVDTSFSPVSSAKPANAVRPTATGAKGTMQVVHISDIHVDLQYETGANWNCTKNICCRPYTTADQPGNTNTPAGPYGDSHCDSPVSLEQSLYAAIKQLAPSAAFTIFTGDVVEGAVWSVTDAEVTNDLTDAYTRMKTIGQVYAVTGNHDVCPVNSFPPADVDTTITSQWAYDTESTLWSSWIGSAAASNVSTNFGSYSTKDAKSGLRIISMNTNFWYKQNFWLYTEPMEKDPSGMLAWLDSEFTKAEKAGERVWLIGHMPLGASDAFHDYSYYFDLLIQRYSATIAAVFYGHTHKDEFQIAYSNYASQSAKTATMMSYIAPALTPTSGNPSFRVYDVDIATGAVLDFTSYYANISAPSYQSGPVWQKLYSAKQVYGAALGYTSATAELTPAFWHNVTALFETNDALFQVYDGYKNRDAGMAPGASGGCTGDCKTSTICQLRAAQSQYNCGTVSPGINFKRGVEEHGGHSHGPAGECEGSHAVSILQQTLGGEGGAERLKDAIVGMFGETFLEKYE